jgi:putative Mn2+ efflux pump MntP
MSFLQVFVFILPLGLDTLGVSTSLGIKSYREGAAEAREHSGTLPLWLRSALLFALAEMLMPLVGLLIGYAASLVVSSVMHYVGALLLIILGAWEFVEEGREYIHKRKKQSVKGAVPVPRPASERFQWGQQLLLALSVSLDELAVGFSLGALTNGASNKAVSPITLCIFIGLQGFIMAVIGLALGRALRMRIKQLKEWTELLSAALLIALGIWLLLT